MSSSRLPILSDMPQTRTSAATKARRRRAADQSFRIAAIDVGSNSIHMIIAQADADGGLTTLWRLKEMVGLGRISFPSKRLTYDAMDRAVETLRRFQDEAKRRQCERIVAVAPSAGREAGKGGGVLRGGRRGGGGGWLGGQGPGWGGAGFFGVR